MVHTLRVVLWKEYAMSRLITPPDHSYKDARGDPLIFLAGPIQGAEDWQAEAVSRIHTLRKDVWIANPRRAERTFGDFGADKYREQAIWEHHHLAFAGKYGVTIFWLANEAEHDCGRAYAQTTRFELGETMAYHRWVNAKMVVGIDSAYTGAKYVRLTFREKAPRVPILDSLQETCEQAIALL